MPVMLEKLAWREISELRERNGAFCCSRSARPNNTARTCRLDGHASGGIRVPRGRGRTGVPVMSALRYTDSQGHTTKWPGTFSLRHETLIATLRDIAAWAVATGWKRILFVNAHFGNDAPARVAVDQLRLAHLGRLQVGFVHVFQLSEAIWESYTSDAADLHANRAETSLMLHLYPELVHLDRLQAADDPDRTEGTVFSYPVAQTSLNGVTGTPSEATEEEGAALFAAMVSALVEKVTAGMTEKPPLPPGNWENIPMPPIY